MNRPATKADLDRALRDQLVTLVITLCSIIVAAFAIFSVCLQGR